MLREALRLVGFQPFKPLERRLLKELSARLGPEAQKLLAAQIGGINLVQRHGKATEVCLYRVLFGSVRPDPRYRFPNQSLEYRLATIRVRVPGMNPVWVADISVVRGFLFSIDFQPPAKPILNRSDIEVEHVKIHESPMEEKPTRYPEKPRDLDAATFPLNGWFAPWRDRYRLSNLTPPLAAAERERRLAQIDASLPEDYLFLVSQTDGVTVEGQCSRASILGLAETYAVSMEDGRHYLLAQLEDQGYLGTPAGNGGGQVVFLGFDGSFRFVDGFRPAVQRFLETGVV